jgi:hypothetical protein
MDTSHPPTVPPPPSARASRAAALAGTHAAARVAMGLTGLVCSARAIQALLVLGAPSNLPEIERVVDGMWLVSIVALAAFVALLVWIHRAWNGAARELGARLPHSAGWAVGWFFVPILNFVRPYQAVRALRDGSDPTPLPAPRVLVENPAASYREPARVEVVAPRFVPRVPIVLWWSMWVAGKALPYFVVLFGSVRVFLAVDLVVDALAYLFTIEVVRGIDACQRERARRLDAMNAPA